MPVLVTPHLLSVQELVEVRRLSSEALRGRGTDCHPFGVGILHAGGKVLAWADFQNLDQLKRFANLMAGIGYRVVARQAGGYLQFDFQPDSQAGHSPNDDAVQ